MTAPTLPGAVAQRAKAAREAIAARSAPRSDETPPTAAPATLPPADPVPTDDTRAADAASNEAPPTPRQPGEKVPLTNWKRRYDLLRAGKDAKTAALEAENRQLRSRMDQGEARTAPDAVPAPNAPSRHVLTQEERDYLGDKEAGTIEKLASHTDDRIDRLEAERAQEHGRRTAEFFEDLDARAPEWKRLDNDPAFNAWLDGTDPDTGVVRRSAFNRLTADFKARTVADLINSYVQLEQASAGQLETPAPTYQASPVPGTSRSAPSPAPKNDEPELIDRAELTRHAQEKARLYRSGQLRDPAVAARIAERDAEIKLAMTERRIR